MISAQSNTWLEEKVLELVKKHQLACEELTESQLVDAIRQALECGDFFKQITKDKSGHSQAVIYIPHAEHEQLINKIRELENRLKALGH